MVESRILKIEGMKCTHCVDKIRRFVGEVEGVKSLNLSLENKTLEVAFEPPATIEAIIEAIEDSGFTANLGD